jgi:hypothetical protein
MRFMWLDNSDRVVDGALDDLCTERLVPMRKMGVVRGPAGRILAGFVAANRSGRAETLERHAIKPGT